MRLEISNTSTSTYRLCPKKFYWNYIQRIKPKRVSDALTLGRAIHDAFHLYYNGMSEPNVIAAIIESFDEDLAKAEEAQTESLEIAKWTAVGMFMYYPYKDLRGFVSIQPEHRFSVRFGNLRDVRFVGSLDGRVKDDKGLYWVREVKTTSLTPQQFQSRCKLSSQATGYVYAELQDNIKSQGVMYDMIKKPRLRKGVNENCRGFCERIVEDYKLDSKKPQNERKCYLRHYEYRSPTQLKQFVEDTTSTVYKIRQSHKNGRWERNTENCWNWGAICPFEKVCFNECPDQLTMELYYDKKGERNGGRNQSGRKETGRIEDPGGRTQDRGKGLRGRYNDGRVSKEPSGNAQDA